ncbi:MAG: phospholipase D-like domain-containing protein [Gemmatimonadota bacterium]|nr:phospholipase D-like domain-containing protein [Gemmatimonadota bacterium]
MSDLLSHPWWLLLLASVGLIGALTVVVNLFFSLGRRPQRMSVNLAPAVGSVDFREGISGSVNAPLMRGGTARLLNNGVEIFPSIMEALGEAQRSINFMVYIWEPGKVSEAIMGALTERARAGVEVRLLLDGMGGMRAPRDELEALEEAGGKVQWFRTLTFGKLTRFHRRNHRRAIIIDGRVGFTGGAAVGDKWLGDARDEEQWRDFMVEVRGCTASNLQSAFTQIWASSCGEILMGPAFYPPDDAGDPAGEHLSWHVNVISSPADESHPLRKFFWTSFRCARKRIWLISPYFVPDDDTRKVIAHRARHGVDVRLLLPDEHTDAGPIRMASHSYYWELLEAGVRIFEFQDTMMHAKGVVIDGEWTIVGSANMDIRSKELNLENVIGILDHEFAAQIERTL